MRSNTSLQISAQERALMGLMVAGVMFVAGYTIVRVNLSMSEPRVSPDTIVNPVPSEGTLWADGF